MDPDLDDLLDDALSDFDKKKEDPKDNEGSEVDKTTDTLKKIKPVKSTSERADGSANLQAPKEIFEQFFDKNISERLQQEWDSAMKELVDEDPALASRLDKLSTTLDTASDAGSAAAPASSSETPSTSGQTDFNKIMDATISGIGKSADELKNMTSASAEENLLREMKNMGFGTGMEDLMGNMDNMEGFGGEFMSMMEGMMKNLLSKDVLYPTMKDISKVYPEWLEANEGEVPVGDFNRYKQQSTIIDKICKCFEEEDENDSNEVKRQKLNAMMNLVEQMQECGNPPKELLEKCGGGNPIDMTKFFGEDGALDPNMLNQGDMDPQSCLIM